MVGKLQSNKVKQAVKIFDYIHSLDNIKLAKKIAQEQNQINKNLKLFIQVNVGDEIQKSGINIDEAKNFLDICKNDLNLNIIGLMCLPPINEKSDKHFVKMLELKKELNLSELSMGMSNDYLTAIEYESSFVRIGSKIFGPRGQ